MFFFLKCKRFDITSSYSSKYCFRRINKVYSKKDEFGVLNLFDILGVTVLGMEHSARCNCWTKRPLTTYYVVFHKGRFVWGVVKTLKTPTWEATCGSLYVCGKLPTYPSPKPTLTLTSHLGQNVGLGVGVGGQFPRNFYARVWKEGS